MDNSRNRARSASAWRVQPPFSPVAVGRQVATQARRILSQKYGPDQKEHANRPAKSAGGRLPWIGANDSMPRAESTAPAESTERSLAPRSECTVPGIAPTQRKEPVLQDQRKR